MAGTGTYGISIDAHTGDLRLPNRISIKSVKSLTGYLGLSSLFIVNDLTAAVNYHAGLVDMDSCTVVGSGAGSNVQADNNTFFGAFTGSAITTGDANVFIGPFAGSFDDTKSQFGAGTDGSAYGTYATDGTAKENIAIGNTTFFSASNGSADNVALGRNVMFYATTVNRNICIGRDTMLFTTESDNNVAVGYHALRNITTGGGNTAVGYEAGKGLTTGTGNVILGSITSSSIGAAATQTTAIGSNARLDFKADANGVTVGDDAPVTVYDFIISNYANLNFADDVAAAAGGILLGGVYHTAGAVKIRLS